MYVRCKDGDCNKDTINTFYKKAVRLLVRPQFHKKGASLTTSAQLEKIQWHTLTPPRIVEPVRVLTQL